MDNLTLQYDLRPEIPNIYDTADYREFRDTLLRIDKILDKTGLEHDLVVRALEKFVQKKQIDVTKFCNTKKAEFHGVVE